jgi:hypothetical protein
MNTNDGAVMLERPRRYHFTEPTELKPVGTLGQ